MPITVRNYVFVFFPLIKVEIIYTVVSLGELDQAMSAFTEERMNYYLRRLSRSLGAQRNNGVMISTLINGKNTKT